MVHKKSLLPYGLMRRQCTYLGFTVGTYKMGTKHGLVFNIYELKVRVNLYIDGYFKAQFEFDRDFEELKRYDPEEYLNELKPSNFK